MPLNPSPSDSGNSVRFGAPDGTALAAAEARFDTLFQFSADGVLLVDPATMRIDAANPALCRMSGYTLEELTQRPVADLHPPETQARVQREMERLRANHTHFAPAVPVRRRDGTVFLADISASLFDRNGKPCMMGLFRDTTARQEAEESLRQQLELRDQLAKVAVSVPGVICSFRLRPDGSASMPFATPAIRDLYDLSPEQVRDDFTPILERIHPDDRDPLFRDILESAQTLKPWKGTFRARHPLRGEIWVEGNSVPRREPDGSTLWFGFIQDVTERRLADEALERSQIKYRIVAENTFDWEFWIGPDGRFLYTSPSCQRITGYRPEDFDQDPSLMQRIVHPDDLPAFHAHQCAAIAGHREEEQRFRIRRADGQVRWIAHVCAPVRDESGALLGVRGSNRDITERVLADDALAVEATRRRILVEGSRDGIVVVDQNGKVVEANHRFASMLGYSAEEVLQLHVWDWDKEWPAERVLEAIRGLGPEGAQFETRHHRKDGSSFDVELSNSTAELGGQKLVFCVCHDISERKRLEAQLRQAQKLEAIGQLAGGVAHDFNNILAAVLMQLDLLRMAGPLSHPVRLGLKDIETQARRAASLTRQLLVLSRRSVLEVKPLDLDAVVKNLLRMLGRLIGEDIKLTFDTTPTPLPAVSADVGMLEQVLMNLVVNARDAMPKGGSLTIATQLVTLLEADVTDHPDRRPGRFVSLSVSDTGTGIKPEIRHRLFEAFFTTKPLGKGSGLGLATVHGIVAQHKGWIEVDSEPGRGTTFRVLLPALSEPIPTTPQPPTSEPLQRGTECILLVEDERPLRQTISQSLRALGYRVHEAAHGPDALALWQRHASEINLLFTDMVMPGGMTGRELADRLRATHPKLKVLISTGYSPEIHRTGGLQPDGITLLAKPYEAKTLARTLRKVLDAP